MECKRERHRRRMQRIQMLQNICQRTDQQKCYSHVGSIHNYVTFNPYQKQNELSQQDEYSQYQQDQRSCQKESNCHSLEELVVNMLSFDLQLENLVNIFPCQLPELLSKVSPVHHTALNLLISSIPSYKKQIKNEDTCWLQMAVYVFQRSVSLWETRWQILEYKDIVNAGSESERMKQNKQGEGTEDGTIVIEKIVDILTGMGIVLERIFFKPLIMRILLDQECKKQGVVDVNIL